MEDLLEGPVYTRPPVWEGMAVPEVLTSGDHGAVARWRREQALARTRAMRPDLLRLSARISGPGPGCGRLVGLVVSRRRHRGVAFHAPAPIRPTSAGDLWLPPGSDHEHA